MPKVDYKDLEEITKFLDKLAPKKEYLVNIISTKQREDAIKLSKMIKDKYIEIKPHYDSTN